MAETDEVEGQKAELLKRVGKYGDRLQKAQAEAQAAREALYPLLYEANSKYGVSLGKLQERCGLTRGRIHQIVQKKPESTTPEEPLQPVRTGGGWG